MTSLIHQNIQIWYAHYGRKELPWRMTTNPYHIYLSEVMLQQTQVKTVLQRFYFPFLEKFPSLKSLKEAHLDEVLKMWEGLGYYSRAKNLHQTAQMIEELPSEIKALEKLKGIGKNTAHAIASFAFKQPVPIMEANVKRVLCRIYQLEEPSTKTLWEIAYRCVDKMHPFEYNQAMMDIGSMICTPKNPKCDTCPLKSICKGKKNPTHYPIKKKRHVPIRKENVEILLCNHKLFLEQRTGKFLHGLWGFPKIETPSSSHHYIGEVSHIYTHFKLITKVYLAHNLKKDKDSFSLKEIDALAISKVDEKIIRCYLKNKKTLA